MDESTRLLDDSYEEKYNKLRELALKLKMKVTEQQALIAKLEAEGPTTANIQSIQRENNILKDQIGEQKKNSSKLQKKLSEIQGDVAEKVAKETEKTATIKFVEKEAIKDYPSTSLWKDQGTRLL